MREFYRDYYGGGLRAMIQAAVSPVQAASAVCNILIGEARHVDLTPADREQIIALAAELEITTKALRSACRRPAPVLLEAAE